MKEKNQSKTSGWGRKGRKGSSAIPVTIISVILITLGLIFVWRVFVYFQAIRSGDTSKLPQFSSQLSFSPDAAEKQAAGSTNRSVLETSDDPSIGPDNADLVIVEFMDYECPFCKKVSGTVRTLADKYSDRVKVIARDYPVLELHPQALTVAEAAGCVEEQGFYWQMHDRIFAEEPPFSRDFLDQIALQSGADREQYEECMDSNRRLEEIKEDVAAGEASGVRGTPTFYFNGQRVEGAIPLAMFEELIKGFLGR